MQDGKLNVKKEKGNELYDKERLILWDHAYKGSIMKKLITITVMSVILIAVGYNHDGPYANGYSKQVKHNVSSGMRYGGCKS